MKLQTTFAVLASLVVATFASTIAEVEADVQTIATQTTTLNNAITSFTTSSGLLAALDIHDDSVTLVSDINQGTTDVNGAPKPFSETDGSTVLTAVQGFEPTILSALSGIVAKKPDFEALPLGGIPALVLQDLINLNASTFAFEAALIASAPADLVATATSIATTVNAAFASAIAAYN